MPCELRASFVPFAALTVGAPFERLATFPKGPADGLRWPTYFEEPVANDSCNAPPRALSEVEALRYWKN